MLEFLARLREWVEDHVSWKVIGMALVIVAVIAFCGGNLYQEWRAEGEGLTLVKEEAVASEEAAASASEETAASGEVVVHVAGAVSAPSVYTLPADSRVDDAVRAAGATADADLSQLNLAQNSPTARRSPCPPLAQHLLTAAAPPPLQTAITAVSSTSTPLRRKSWKACRVSVKCARRRSSPIAKSTAVFAPSTN